MSDNLVPTARCHSFAAPGKPISLVASYIDTRFALHFVCLWVAASWTGHRCSSGGRLAFPPSAHPLSPPEVLILLKPPSSPGALRIQTEDSPFPPVPCLSLPTPPSLFVRHELPPRFLPTAGAAAGSPRRPCFPHRQDAMRANSGLGPAIPVARGLILLPDPGGDHHCRSLEWQPQERRRAAG